MPDKIKSNGVKANWLHISAIFVLGIALLVLAGAICLLYGEDQPTVPSYQALFATVVPASDPDVSASMSREDDSEYNNNDNTVTKDSDNKYDEFGEKAFEQDVVVVDKTTTELANVKAHSEFDSDSNSAETIAAEASYSSTLRRLEQQQQELMRCYAAKHRSEADLPEAGFHTKQLETPSPSTPLLSEFCLQCLCETATECHSVDCGVGGGACGIFRISFNYWIDAGRPSLQGVNGRVNMTERDVFTQCVSNSFCAARAVEANMKKYARDCNMDGKIDCLDYAELHILGPTGCLRNELPPVFEIRLNNCWAKFN